jgi:hypothetical protein
MPNAEEPRTKIRPFMDGGLKVAAVVLGRPPARRGQANRFTHPARPRPPPKTKHQQYIYKVQVSTMF